MVIAKLAIYCPITHMKLNGAMYGRHASSMAWLGRQITSLKPKPPLARRVQPRGRRYIYIIIDMQSTTLQRQCRGFLNVKARRQM